MDKKGLGGLLVVLLVLGFGAVLGVLPVLQHNLAVQEHRPTEAVVQSTDIEVDRSDDDTTYTPVVTYRYTVDGESYTEDNVFPGQFTRSKGNRGWAEDVISNYSVGQRVTVYYSPRVHGQAYLENRGWPDVFWIIGVLVPIGAVGAGGYYIRKGFIRRKQRTLMEDTPTEQVQSLSMGPSEVTGDAVTKDLDPLPAPFSQEECVLAKYEIEEYEEDDDGGNWQTVEEDVVHAPFYLDDGTGAVLVRPDDEATYDLDPEDWTKTYVDSSQYGPDPVQQFVENTPGLGFPSDAHGKENDRRYKQNLIKDGESAYVFGTVQPREDATTGSGNAGNAVIQKVPEDDPRAEPMFLISDDSEKNLVHRRKWALWRLPVGIGFAIGGLFGLLAVFGPLIGVELPVLL